MQKRRKNILSAVFILTAIACVSFYIGSVNKNTKADSILFSDVKETDWFYDDVKFVSEQGLMNGTDDDKFSPAENTTRGMIVTILWRLNGEERETGNSFSDVSEKEYYHDAVVWASNNKIVSGYDDKTFGADDAMTREQMVTILYRYAEYMEYDITQKSSLDEYKDKAEISQYAVEAIEWGHANGIITGTSDTALSPQGNVLRCQAAAILHRFCEKYADYTSNDEKNNAQIISEAPTEKASSSGGGSGSQNKGGSGGGGSASGAVKETKEPEEKASAVPTEKSIKVSELPTVSVSDAEAKAGEDVKVNVTINNNPGILGMTLIAYYDEAYCTLESVENGEAFSGILDLTPANELKSGARFMWSGIDITDDQIKDGTALIMNFRIKDNAPEGRVPVTVKCYDGDAVDRELNNIALQAEDGNITVKSN